MGTNAEDNAREAMPEIERLRAELAARKRGCTCPYWVTTDAVMPSPNCPTHGVDELDRRTLSARAVSALRSLVILKDGPRDEIYQTRKGGGVAWDQARSVLRDLNDLS
jgi:hypothetical protein